MEFSRLLRSIAVFATISSPIAESAPDVQGRRMGRKEDRG
jgi:hypothetical protein